MTNEQIDALSGRELDVAVAEVLGWTRHAFGNVIGQMQPPDRPVVNGIEQVRMVPRYSTDHGAAVKLLLDINHFWSAETQKMFLSHDNIAVTARGDYCTAACRSFLKWSASGETKGGRHG